MPCLSILHLSPLNDRLIYTHCLHQVTDEYTTGKLTHLSSSLEALKLCQFELRLPCLKLPSQLMEVFIKLIAPDGSAERVKGSSSPQKTLLIDFTPKDPGEHKLHITKAGKAVSNSPFVIQVEAGQLYNTSSVVSMQENKVLEKCSFVVEANSVRPEQIKETEVLIQCPDGVYKTISHFLAKDKNNLAFDFIPQEPGNHKVYVNKFKKPIVGSPFTIEVQTTKEYDTAVIKSLLPKQLGLLTFEPLIGLLAYSIVFLLPTCLLTSQG